MAYEIPVYLFVGFLESGKTKFIQETMEDPQFDSGDKTLLLVCEEGEEEYDPDKFAFGGVTVEVLEDKSQLNRAHLEQLTKKSGAGRVVAVSYTHLNIQGVIAQVKPLGKGQHKGGAAHRDHDAGEHQAGGDGVHILLYLGRVGGAHQDGGIPALDIAKAGEQQEDGGIHDVEPDDLADQVLLQQKVHKPDAEQNHRSRKDVILSKNRSDLLHSRQKSPLLKSA